MKLQHINNKTSLLYKFYYTNVNIYRLIYKNEQKINSMLQIYRCVHFFFILFTYLLSFFIYYLNFNPIVNY